jgi:membrane dipeptidase
MKNNLLLILLLTLLLPALVNAATDRERRAAELVQQYPLVDTHIDVPYRINHHWEDVSGATAEGQFDYPRAVAGGLNIAFMSIYTPAESELDGSAYGLANTLIDQVEAIVQRAPDKFALVRSSSEAREQFEAGKIALALGMENGAPVAGDLENLRHFHRRGVSYITLAHSLSNHISDSSYDEVALWQGLSPFGVELVGEMNKLGMMVDISHLSDKAAREVLAVSRSPVIASHSSLRHFVPEFKRNMDDALLLALAQKGGIIMINFGSSFLTRAANDYSKAFRPAATAFAEQRGLNEYDPALELFTEAYQSKHPYPFATVGDVADHIDHVVQLVGIDFVGLGSDFDGVGDSLPVGLKDVGEYPNLVVELLRRNYQEEEIAAILGGNLLRVWQQVEAGAVQ